MLMMILSSSLPEAKSNHLPFIMPPNHPARAGAKIGKNHENNVSGDIIDSLVPMDKLVVDPDCTTFFVG